MGSVLLILSLSALILLSFFIVLIVLMQRTSSGVGEALGGGATESAFGAQGGNVLTRWTIYSAVVFFILAFGLYLWCMARYEHRKADDIGKLPAIVVPETTPQKTPGSLTEVPNAAEQ